jgi:integrase
MLATMTLAALRVSEATGLRWRAVDTAKGTLTVEESKTEAGEGRKVDLTPMLREVLTLHRANSANAGPDDLVFPTSTGQSSTGRTSDPVFSAGRSRPRTRSGRRSGGRRSKRASRTTHCGARSRRCSTRPRRHPPT